MAIYAVVESGIVVNVIEYSSGDEYTPSGTLVEVTSPCSIGWSYDGSSFTDERIFVAVVGANNVVISILKVALGYTHPRGFLVVPIQEGSCSTGWVYDANSNTFSAT